MMGLWRSLNKERKFNWRRFLPLLYVDIQVPFLQIRTILMHKSLVDRSIDYVTLQLVIWKWKFTVGLWGRMK
jgi:hypothetical protein